MGDAVYTKTYDINALSKSLNDLLRNQNYTDFAASALIDGVWDDHDYGMNDGGKSVVDQEARMVEYLRFLAASNPYLQDEWRQQQIDRQGLYHSVNIPMGDNIVKVLFLDTRSFRDDHFVPSLGQIKFPLSAILASALRGAYSILGFGRHYGGQMLGDAQWRWLHGELQGSTADVHVLVSSVQVLTSNPVVESWGHFPQEKKRLMNLLAEVDPRNLFFLSGDVHLGEISEAIAIRSDRSISKWTEITSSGLTHTCADSLPNRVLCPLMMTLFSAHRSQPDAYFTRRNFGTMELVREDDRTHLRFAVRSLETDSSYLQPQLSVSVNLTAVDTAVATAVSRAPIVQVDFADFYVIPAYLQLPLAINVLLILRLVISWLSRLCISTRSARNENQTKKNE